MKYRVFAVGVVAVLCVFVGARFCMAQDSLTLSVTPPLYQLNVAPGDSFRTNLKIINTNPYPLTVYAEIADFTPDAQGSHGIFTAREGGFDPQGPRLSSWMEVTGEPIVIEPEQSLEIPVSLTIPQNAAPGGHYAAILIGTRPPHQEGSLVRTSQVVTSLFFLRVAGDVIEQGSIREFSVAKLFREKPEATFKVRFENTGNVHIQPQGQITVRNMWGKERGIIPINQRSNFGNVLPGSIRAFEFAWQGEPSLSDIGVYTAELTLTYGEDGRQNISSATRFFVVPLRGLAVTLAVIAAFIWLLTRMVWRYIARALALAGHSEPITATRPQKSVPLHLTREEMARPLREGVLDLRTRMKAPPQNVSRTRALLEYIKSYKLFFGTFAGICIFALIGVYFARDVLRSDKPYAVTLNRGDQQVTLTDAEIEQAKTVETSTQKDDASVEVVLVNESQGTNLDAVRARVRDLSYTIVEERASERVREHSAIVFSTDAAQEALKLSQTLGDVPLSARDSTSTSTEDITLFIGTDMLE